MSGSSIGTVVGGVIGFYFGGPTGAQFGAAIGGAVGGYIKPDVIKGQRLTDAQVQTSNEGVSRPIVYGIAVVAGNIIQRGPLVETKTKERAGKGGPVQETYHYSRSYAVRVCEGPVAGIRRVWRDDKLVYDLREVPELNMAESAKFKTTMTIYLGGETQLPDPTLEALPANCGGGAGNVPAHRGTCYVVFSNDDLTDRQGTVPQYRFEIAAGGAITGNIPGNVYGSYGADVLRSGSTPESWPNQITVTGNTSTVGLVYSAHGALFAMNVDGGKVTFDRVNWYTCTGLPAIRPAALWWSLKLRRWYLLPESGGSLYYSLDGKAWSQQVFDTYAGVHYAAIYFSTNYVLIGSSNNSPIRRSEDGGSTFADASIVTAQATLAFANSGSAVMLVTNSGIFRSVDFGLTFSAVSNPAGASGVPVSIAHGNGLYLIMTTTGQAWLSINDGVSFTLGGSIDSNMGNIGPSNELIFVSPYFVVSHAGVSTTIDGVNFIKRYTPTAGQVIVDNATVFESGTRLPDIPGFYLDENGNIYGGAVTRDTQPSFYLGSIERDIADRVGIVASQFDTTQIDAISVRGFVIGQQMPAADVLRSLQQGFFHDLPEYDGKLRAILRGGPALFDLSESDLVWSDDDEDTRAQAVEFPRKINLISSDPNSNYEPTKQTAERRTNNIKAVGEGSIELPLVLTRDEAAQKADIMLKIAWEQAQGRWERELPEKFSQLTPADPFTYGGKRWLASQVEYLDGIVRVEAARDRVSSYTSSATGVAGVLHTTAVSGLRGPTRFVAMNLPSLRTADNVPGMYVAAQGILPGWLGAQLQLSVDGGLTFQDTIYMLTPAVMGYLEQSITASGSPMTVKTYGGVLESITAAQVTARLNGFAVGDSIPEVGQFQTAIETTPDVYQLTNLIRGGLGTAAVSHSVGESFVLLDSGVHFLPLDMSLAGKTLIFRPVSIGTAAANNATFEAIFTPQFTTVVIDRYVNDVGAYYFNDAGSTYYKGTT